MTAAQWIVIDNLCNNWPYRSNLDWDAADKAYRWAVENEYVKDGRITDAGRGARMAEPTPKG